ncbi:DMT family transporter [Janthinobacterium fluminis]|uniref:DMT family transporter n=1 Tax=Janthinobacterium fluminis TaxID=2987524 RepID=A0ABT5JVD2_9BURK|nr:DMT family transporter [Janthinobacterium fluminis]MDC8756589.1 DMT family transporter [Janthinobacterium fluminis]
MQNKNLSGICWMVLDAMIMSLMLLCGKALGDLAYHPLQIVFLATLLAAVFNTALFFRGQWQQIRPQRPFLHLRRALLSVASTACLLSALQSLSLFEVSAFSLLIPVLTGMTSIVVLRESPSGALWLSTAVSVAGVALLLAARYNHATLPHPILAGVAFGTAAVLTAVLNNLNMKKIGREEALIPQMIFGPACSALLLLPAMFFVWQPLRAPAHCSLLLYGLLLAARMVTRYRAFHRADLSALMPIEYTQLLFSALFAYAFFGQRVTFVAGIGMVLVAAGGLILVRGELRRNAALLRR